MEKSVIHKLTSIAILVLLVLAFVYMGWRSMHGAHEKASALAHFRQDSSWADFVELLAYCMIDGAMAALAIFVVACLGLAVFGLKSLARLLLLWVWMLVGVIAVCVVLLIVMSFFFV